LLRQLQLLPFFAAPALLRLPSLQLLQQQRQQQQPQSLPLPHHCQDG
jgi:hypothetical protein